MKYNILSILMLILKMTDAQYQDTKKISKLFPLKEYTEIEISNRYGIVHVNNWDKDSLYVEVEITAYAKSNEKLEKTMNNIDIGIVSTDYFVNIKSLFIDNSRNLISDFNKVFFDNEHTTKINYTVYIPQSANIKIENKYGDIYCGNLNGNVELSVSYGKLKANRLTGKSKIDVRSGEATINELKKGTLICYYSEVHINNTKELEIESHDSEIEISNSEEIKVSSKRDRIDIENTLKMEINSDFTDINIEKVENKIFGEMRYGNITIKNINNSFSDFNIKSKYTNTKLFFENALVTYNIDIIHKNSRIIYPRDIAKIDEKLIDINEKRYRTTGKIGNETSASMNIFMTCDFGEIALFHK